jgi:hypothetical protein
MLAYVLWFPQLLARMTGALREEHFLPNERQHWVLYHEISTYANNSGSTFSLDAVRAAIQRRIEGCQLGVDEHGLHLQELLAEGGLLDRIAARPSQGLAATEAEPLIHRFLRERDVFAPLIAIFQSPLQHNGWTVNTAYPTETPAILRHATDRLDAIDAEWGGVDSWGPPESLDGPELPQFPVEVLPPTLWEWVHAVATATQTPLDLAASLVLAVVAAAGQRLIEVEVRDGWIEPINVYVLAVLGPGNRKSAVYSLATHPLRAHEREAVERSRLAVQAYERQVRVLEGRIKDYERAATRASEQQQRDEVLRDAESAQQELNRLERQVEPKIIVDDCTSEKLEALLADQGGRIAVMSAEGGGPLSNMKGRYSDEPKFEVYLKAHSGDDLRTDRLGRQSVHVERPAVTLALCIQPEVARSLGEKDIYRGQGLLARFLLVNPRSPLGSRDTNPAAVPQCVSDQYERIVRQVCQLGNRASHASGLWPQRLQLADDARSDFERFLCEHEPRLAVSGGALAGMQDWASKLPGAVGRIAGILHLITEAERFLQRSSSDQTQEHRNEHEPQRPRTRVRFEPWSTPISASTVQAAITIGHYLTAHAEHAFSMMGMTSGLGGQVLADAWHVVRWVRNGDHHTFTQSQLQQQNRSRFHKASDVDPVLDLLEARNIIRPDSATQLGPRGGRPPSRRFKVNPGVFAAEYLCGQEN